MQTTRTTWLSLVVALGLAALPACGGDDGGGGGDSDGGTTDGSTTDGGTSDGSTTDGGTGDGSTTDGGTTTITDVTDMTDPVTRAMCDRLATCQPETSVIFSPVGCEGVMRPLLDRAFQQAQQRVDDGDLTFDPAKGRECIDAIAGFSCDELDMDRNPLGSIPACREALTGGKTTGESCSDDIECAPTLYCDRSMACPGTCAEPVAAGGSCQLGQPCADGQVCFVPDSSTDGTGTCMAPAGEGDACDTEDGPPCGGALRCNTPDGETAGTCGREVDITTGAATGEPCGLMSRDAATLCADGLACVLSGGLTGTCQAAGIAEGESCPLAMPDPCAEGLYCDGLMLPDTTTGTCKPLPAAGEACAPPPGPFGDDGPFEDGLCAAGLVCDQTESTPTCVAPKANDQPCRSSMVCASGYCEIAPGDDTGTCKDRPACY